MASSKQNLRFEISKVTHNDSFSMKAPHTHSYYEVFYLVSGRCMIIIDEEKYQLLPGDLALIRPNHPHMTIYSLGFTSERICLELSATYLQGVFDTVGLSNFESATTYPILSTDKCGPHIANSLDLLLSHTKNQFTYSKEIRNAAIMQLFFLILSCPPNISTITTEGSINEPNINVDKAIEYIHMNYAKKLSLNELAHTLHLNPSYFSKLFKDVTGKGFAKYVLSVRLVKAENLLLETDKSVTEIALSCGFGNSNYFCEAFRKKNNISPTDFRKIKGNLI